MKSARVLSFDVVLASFFVVFLSSVVTTAHAQTPSYRSLGSFKVPYPGFLNFGHFPTGNNTLLISSFSGSPFSHDQVSFVPDMGQKLNFLSTITPEILTTKLIWPNEATQVPREVFGSDRVVAVGNGFLVPGKSNGQISLFTDDYALTGQNTTGPFVISQMKDEWFYHLALWYDMDKDGLMDCVTARATKPTDGNGQGELVWYKQPKSNPFGQEWQIFVLASGPDIFIRLADLDNNGDLQIIAAEFFNASITVWWSSNQDWTDPSTMQSVVVDNTIGPLFDVGLVDLNADGNLDLLATNHDHKASVSGAFGYEIPQGFGNWKTQPWTRNTLVSNIKTLKLGPNQASPGNANAFHPLRSQSKEKPWILLSGDGAEQAFMLVPQSQTPSNWTYSSDVIIKTGCTVGQIAVADANEDGYADFFVPAFEKGIVYGYTFAP